MILSLIATTMIGYKLGGFICVGLIGFAIIGMLAYGYWGIKVLRRRSER
jgi:hypothetical protein